MASVMGRSCGYGVHLRSCFPLVTSSPISPYSLASLSRLGSCFFLRFSTSSCRNRRLKLCTAPPLAFGRRVHFVHGVAEQEGSSASSPLKGLQKSRAVKRVTSRKEKMEGAEIKSGHVMISSDAQSVHALLAESASASSLLSAQSKGKATRRRAFGDGLAGDEKLATSKRTRKKSLLPDTGITDAEKVLSVEAPPSKSPRRRKKSSSADFEDKLQPRVAGEPATPLTSSSSQVSSSVAVFSTPKTSRKNKRLSSDSPEDKSTLGVDRNQTSSLDAVSSSPKKAARKKKTLSSNSSEDTQNPPEEGSHVILKDKAILAAPIERAGNKRTLSVLTQEESSSQEKKIASSNTMDKASSFESETLVLQKEDAKPRDRRKVFSKAKQVTLSLCDNDAALPGSVDAMLKEDKPMITEMETSSSPKKEQRPSKARDSANPDLLSENKTRGKMQRGKTKQKEPLINLESDHPASETVSLDSSVVAAGKLTSESMSQVDSFWTHEEKVEGISKPCICNAVRDVENSVDKASLTDEMPVISVTASHISYRRRQSEALQLPRDPNVNNFSINETAADETLTQTSKSIPEPMSILEDSVLKSSRAFTEKTGSIDISSSSPQQVSDTVKFMDGIDQQTAASRAMPHKMDDLDKKDDSISHTLTNLGIPAGSQMPMVPRRNASASRWMENSIRTKSFSAPSQQYVPSKQNSFREREKTNRSREDVKSQQWAHWQKNETPGKQGANGASVQTNEISSNVQFNTGRDKERDLQQGYNLANRNRAYGTGQKKRKEFSIRKVVANQASTTSYMQIYGTGFDTGETVPTVLLFFDRRRFIFNVGEGLQRFCMEHKFKLSKIDHVFLTRVCSETSGGLPGLILTLAELGESGLTVQTWGPSSLQDLARAMRTFVPSGWMEHTHCFGAGEDTQSFIEASSSSPILLLEDELIRISAVLLHPENSQDSSTSESVSLEERNGGMTSTVYICELSTVPGKFDPEKASAKGLKPGYKYGRLQRGESVMSDDGTITVHPDDVLGPSSPGPIMLLVDCPSSSYVSSLTSSTSLQSYFSETGKVVNCMIHIGPGPVTRSKDYQSWMGNFKETHHIMARQEVKVLGTPTLRYSAKLISKLNLVCPLLFPIVEPDAVDKKEVKAVDVIDGGNLLKYHFRPLTDLGPDGSDIPEAFNHVSAQNLWRKENPHLLRACEIASQAMKGWSQVKSSWSSRVSIGRGGSQDLPACLQHVSRDEMELVFLGTGSSQPAKHRNVTGIYIHLFARGGILLDCGEGTYAQLKRRYGSKGADDVLMDLKCIWISHMHADHFSGLARILSARRQLLEAQSAVEPILVVGPKKLNFFLAAYRQVEDIAVEFLDCSQTTLEVQSWVDRENSTERGAPAPAPAHKRAGLVGRFSEAGSGKSGMHPVWKQPGFHIQQGVDVAGREKLKRVLNELGLKDLCSVPVVHCPQAFAVVLEAEGRKVSESEAKPGWKLVYSGDTRPCQALVKAARGATILIHEATFDDELIAEAVKKNHSMTKEAIEVGVAAQVYRIFLTHFSQRYPTIPSFDNRYSDRTSIAYDMMSVNLADLPVVPKLMPALQFLFGDKAEVEEDLVVNV